MPHPIRLTREEELIIECVKIRPDYDILESLVKQGIAWDKLYRQIIRHGVHTIIFDRLKRIEQYIPRQDYEKLRRGYFVSISHTI